MGQTYGTFNGGLSSGGGTAVAAGINALYGMWQQHYAAEQANWDRSENYRYNEQAAENADARTRALYNDFYSPEALMRQYKEAGLSPSMMFGGTPGQGGASGAMGAGAHGPQTPFAPHSLVDAAQAAALFTQAQKTKAETKNITIDTERQEIQKGIEELAAGQYKTEWEILNSQWTNEETGEAYSLFEMADHHYSYESFINDIRTHGKEKDPTLYEASQTEAGQKILRVIYQAASQFNADIMLLSSETVSSKFQLDLVTEMRKQGFIQQNVQTTLKQLKAIGESADLTSEQKGSWNNILERLRKKNSTMADVVIVLGMILNNTMTNWNIPNINISGSRHQYKLSGGTWKEL